MDRVEEQVKLLKKAVVDLLLSHLELQQQRLGDGFLGFCVHGVVVKKGFVECNVFVCNVLTMMYFNSGVLRDARKVFDKMCQIWVEDVFSWNSIVVVGGEKGEFGVRVDAVSLVNVLPACGVVKVWRRGKEVHGYAVRSGLSEDVFVGNAIVDMNAKCELMDDVSKVNERMKVTDVVSWTAMVTEYFQVGRFEDAWSLFEMIKVEKRFGIDGKWNRKIGEDGFWLRLGDFCSDFS
ncbi:pentatricopeptide repeat-containing protein At5g16860-like [Apium graveolens]|uniref:pentatricopeptide repeat-containing protein At5g16860-like n=1 Tax=Apium graveolens TaxID=4045 RepID=UPI003D7A66A4